MRCFLEKAAPLTFRLVLIMHLALLWDRCVCIVPTFRHVRVIEIIFRNFKSKRLDKTYNLPRISSIIIPKAEILGQWFCRTAELLC